MTEKHKVVIVTGGLSGIGYSTVLLLIEMGWKVVVFDIANHVSDNRQHFDFIKVDVSIKEEIVEAVKEVVDKYTHIDALVNCAGIYPSVRIDDYTDEIWKKCFDLNVNGPYFLSMAVVPYMEKQGGGRIVNVTSGAVYLGSRDIGYCASKSALAGLTKSLAVSLAKKNIHVNSVSPGPIDTPMSRKGMRSDDIEDYIKRIPLHRFGKSDEVANAIHYLISEDSSYLTGSTLHINGGLFLN